MRSVSTILRGLARACAGTHTARAADYWVKVSRRETIAEAVTTLRDQGMQVLALLSDQAVDFAPWKHARPHPVWRRSARHRIQALALADQDIIIPMVGIAPVVERLGVVPSSSTGPASATNPSLYQQECRLPRSEQGSPAVRTRRSLAGSRLSAKTAALPAIIDEGEVIADEVGGSECNW